MSRKTWLLIFFCKAGIAFAQDSQLDSLVSALENHPGNDTVRLDILNELSFALYTVNPNRGLELSEQAIALATELNSLSRLATAYNNKGTNHWAKGEDSVALAAGEHALEIHKKTGNKLGAAKTLNNLALNYYNLSAFRKALEYHDAALSLFRELDHTEGIAHSYSNAGVVYLSLSDYPRALENLLNAARVVQGGTHSLQANILLNIGLVYKNMKEYPKALQYTREALDYYVRFGQKQGEANALGNLGTILSEQGAAEEALGLYRQSLSINTTIGNKRRIASDLVNIAVVHRQLKNPITALQYLRESLRLYEQTNDKENTAFTLVKLVELYLDGMQKGSKKDVNAFSRQHLLQYLQRARDLADESGSLEKQRMVWKVSSEAFEELGLKSKALEAYKKYIAFRDSIYNSDKQREIARQQIQFDYEKKEALLKAGHEKEMALAGAEIARQKAIDTALLAGSILLILAAMTVHILNKKKKHAEKCRKEAEFQALIAETKMKALRAQMNPHFIFNSLNSISNFIATNRPDFAEEYVIRLAKVIRLTLESSEHKEISLSDDLKILELYLQLERVRLKDKFVYEIQTAESIDPENTLVPPLILQPIVENSIWHGVSKLQAGGKISIRIDQTSERLICHVDDNGPGRRKSAIDIDSPKIGRKSLGLRITRSRLDILNGQELSRANISFIDKSEGLRVTVILPLLYKFQPEHD